MSKGNMFENNIFDNLSAGLDVAPSANSIQKKNQREQIKADVFFSLKNLDARDRKPTTIIFSKRNYILLKKLALDANLNMSEFVNRWLERMEVEE